MTTGEPLRPDPDALLEEAARASRGRLKVFLGMAPGVGKTFEMLRSARRAKVGGEDVVVGVVESHGRQETQSLLRGLEVMARRPMEHRGRSLLEFDLDGALARRPALLLVDEYAHSNAPGSRHPKRWQDVAELLDAGIDVWTTLNVQHLESLNDVVWKITGVRQLETVPDSALSAADEIELIDLTPEELRRRLADGKVYVPETARLASEKFFRLENLTALRELALRRAAQTVDDQLVGAMKRAGVEGPWAAGERILVLIGADPVASSLIRAGRRLSDMIGDAPWTVAHIERPSHPVLDEAAQQHLAGALKLAEQLGAATLVLSGEDIVVSVKAYVRQNNVTQILVGNRRFQRRRPFGRPSLTAALLEDSTGAALHVVTEAPQEQAANSRRRLWPAGGVPWQRYLSSGGFVAIATGIAYLLQAQFADADLSMVFLTAVLASGVLHGLRPALLAATAAFLVYNFLFIEPLYTFWIGSPANLLALFGFWAVALATGGLAGRVRDQARALARHTAAITSLLAVSRRLSAATTKTEVAQAIADHVSAGVGGEATVLLPEGGEIAAVAGTPTLTPLGTSAMTAARWAWERGEVAGAGTGTLPQLPRTFYPLQGSRVRAGVVGVEHTAPLTPEAQRYLTALLDQGAVALERAEFAADAADAEALRRSDRLRAALLNSISHDLRTPLSTVLGSATTLLDYGPVLEPDTRQDLLLSIREEAERLSRYVGDLLDMTRLEGGALVTRQEWTDIRDVLAAAIERVQRRAGSRRFERDFPADLSLIKADPGLVEQAVVNILENAIAYSPDGTTIEVAAYEDRRNIVISIEDEGRGVPTAELERVFEKFHRLEEPSDRHKGSGLGLAISKGFVEAMGGQIAAASPIHDGRGTRVLISLPKPATPPEAAA